MREVPATTKRLRSAIADAKRMGGDAVWVVGLRPNMIPTLWTGHSSLLQSGRFGHPVELTMPKYNFKISRTDIRSEGYVSAEADSPEEAEELVDDGTLITVIIVVMYFLGCTKRGPTLVEFRLGAMICSACQPPSKV